MTATLRCDHCGQIVEAETSATLDWLIVERMLSGFSHVGEASGPWHFCDEACLEQWARKRRPADVMMRRLEASE